MSAVSSGIRKFYSCFLFRKNAEKKRGIFWAWNFVMIVLSSAAVGVASLVLAYGNYSPGIFKGYFKIPLIAFLNIIPIVVFTLVLYFLVGRSWIAHLIVSGVVTAASLGDYYKLRFRDDPFIAADFSSISTGLKVSGNYDITVGVRVIAAILIFVLSTLFLAFFVRGRLRLIPRGIGFAVAVGAAVLTVALCFNDSVFNKIENFDYPGANRWSDTQKQISRGFVYPFIHSIPDALPNKPAGYSDGRAEEILSRYTDEEIPENRRVNIIAIQLEAYADLELLGVEGISPDVYRAYRELEKESVTGTLVTNIFAGGTIDTERCFVTGYPELDNFRSPVGSYVRYLKKMGYFTEGGHASYDWFYNRKNINDYLGFDEYFFSENRYREMTGKDISLDDVMIPDILKMYRDRDASVPYFNFSVTYQGHGPYPSEVLEWGDGYWSGEGVSEYSRTILTNYLGSVADTTRRIGEFTDELRDDPDPVVVVLFGDHKPWLGNGNSVYEELGVSLDVSEETGFYNYFSTRYLIWANGAAKDALGVEVKGEGPTVSPCFLMNVVFDVCGLGKGPAYMQLMSDLMEITPVVNTTGFWMEDGKITSDPSGSAVKALEDVRIAQYYRKRHPEC